MLENNSDKIRQVKGTNLLQSGVKTGGKQGRPRLLHNGVNGQKGGTNAKGTPAKPGIMKDDHLGALVSVLKGKKRGV